jgi:hypothetical protein
MRVKHFDRYHPDMMGGAEIALSFGREQPQKQWFYVRPGLLLGLMVTLLLAGAYLLWAISYH